MSTPRRKAAPPAPAARVKRAAPAAARPGSAPPGRARKSTEKYKLRLYVAGMTPRSQRAIANIRSICEEFLVGRYDLEVVDVFQRPVLTREEQIFAVPTLVKRLPAPIRRFIGDLSEREKVLIGLDLQAMAAS